MAADLGPDTKKGATVVRDNQNLTIGILSVTATILFVGVVFVTMLGQNTALAIGQTDRGGDYIVVTGQFTQNSELVYVTDAAAKRLNSYAYDATQRQVILWDTQDLGKVFASAKN